MCFHSFPLFATRNSRRCRQCQINVASRIDRGISCVMTIHPRRLRCCASRVCWTSRWLENFIVTALSSLIAFKKKLIESLTKWAETAARNFSIIKTFCQHFSRPFRSSNTLTKKSLKTWSTCGDSISMAINYRSLSITCSSGRRACSTWVSSIER